MSPRHSLHISPPEGEARNMTAMTSLFLRNACLPCSMYSQVRLRAPFSSARLAPRPDGPLTHFASPRVETCRLVFPRPSRGSYKRETPVPLSTALDQGGCFTSESSPFSAWVRLAFAAGAAVRSARGHWRRTIFFSEQCRAIMGNRGQGIKAVIRKKAVFCVSCLVKNPLVRLGVALLGVAGGAGKSRVLCLVSRGKPYRPCCRLG